MRLERGELNGLRVKKSGASDLYLFVFENSREKISRRLKKNTLAGNK